MNLKENLKKLRKENNLSQEELAEKLNVSRQSVSKWEQGITYPEMDKMLEICKLFNLNIDDLLNGDIKESNNAKQAKYNINKFIESFLGYVSKTVDMFSSMKFRNKLGCIMEQWLIILCMYIVFKIIGNIGENIISNMLSFLPTNVYKYGIRFIESIYALAAVVLGVILLLHIFKTRYLDYYEIVKKDTLKEQNKEESKKEEKEEVKKIYLEKKKEKVIIRDPKHSEYGFISSLVKFVLFIFKLIALFIFGMMCISLITISISLVLSFILIKTGLLFVGILLIILACILLNCIFLKIFYSFIFNGKLNKNTLITLFFASLISIGIGTGLTIISVPEYDVVNFEDEEYYIKEQETIKMDDNMFFINERNINYIETDNNDLTIEYVYMKNNELVKEKIGNGYSVYIKNKESNISTMMKDFMEALKDKKLLLDNDYSIYINVYTNKSNIDKLKNNLEDYINHERILSCEYNKKEYITKINELNEKINSLQNSCN